MTSKEWATVNGADSGTVDGFSVGQLVWEQMYSPQYLVHSSTIEERIKHGNTYGPRRLMCLRGILHEYGTDRHGNPLTRWWLSDPARPNDESRMSWVESDWCVLEDASAEGAMLW